MAQPVWELASYQRAITRIRATWANFCAQRQVRLAQERRHGAAAERVAENILEDLFTQVLDWTLADCNNQVGYADLVLSRLGVKYLLLEAKRPGALAWNRRAVEIALDQACRYADEQQVKCIAISDGVMLYAATRESSGLKDRIFVSLDSPTPPDALWWLSVHGIYRPCEYEKNAPPDLLPAFDATESPVDITEDRLLHPKYQIPASCFAFVGDARKPASWKLPYRLADGQPDIQRLPKAIQAILNNYRGAKVTSVPESAIPDVLVRLALEALRLGRMPHQSGHSAPVYIQLENVLRQMGRLNEVVDSPNGTP
ncbi:MAG: hypothetical protein ACYDEV_05075 [Acidiferrobacter sp.]